jgi:hypothetical protein
MKAPNSKLQAPEKRLSSSFNAPARARRLEFEAWNFSGAWMLVFGAFPDGGFAS